MQFTLEPQFKAVGRRNPLTFCIAVVNVVRQGAGVDPGWENRPHTSHKPNVLTLLRRAIQDAPI